MGYMACRFHPVMVGVENTPGDMTVMKRTLKIITLSKCLDFRHRQLLDERLSLFREAGEYPDIILNLSTLKWINVFTISAILNLHEKLQNRGRHLGIRGCREEVYGAFIYLGLDKLMNISPEPTRDPTASTP